MRFCDTHWEEIRHEIETRGLNQFIAKSGEEALARTVAELKDGYSKATFEPLMYAHNAIVANAMEIFGMEIMEDNADGSSRCPLCHVISNCNCKLGEGCHFRAWPKRAADDALDEAKNLGLVGGA